MNEKAREWTIQVFAMALIVFAMLGAFAFGAYSGIKVAVDEAYVCERHCASTEEMGGAWDELRGVCVCSGEVRERVCK